jgi:hypothetical protein
MNSIDIAASLTDGRREGNEISGLLAQHRKYLRDRGVTDSIAIERGYQSALRKTDLEQLGFGRAQQLTPAMVIPILSVRGEVGSYQIRPDTPRLNEKGRPRKFETKAGGRMLIDAHSRLTRKERKATLRL